MVSMLPNLVSRLNDFSDHLQVFFVFVFVFFWGGRIGNFPVQCLGHAYVNLQY